MSEAFSLCDNGVCVLLDNFMEYVVDSSMHDAMDAHATKFCDNEFSMVRQWRSKHGETLDNLQLVNCGSDGTRELERDVSGHVQFPSREEMRFKPASSCRLAPQWLWSASLR